jgi:hypothetical protein
MAKATLLSDRRFEFADGSFWRIRLWSVPESVPPSTHHLKYSLVYIVNGERVIGYDNERGKGDHRHYGDVEVSYSFRSDEQLVADFLADVEDARNDSGKAQGGR